MPITLETKRLVLRSAVAGDAEPLFREYFGDIERSQYLARRPHADVTQTQRVLHQWCSTAWVDGDPRFAWVISESHRVNPIGILFVIGDDNYPARAEIHYGIARKESGRGLATEAVCGASDWLLQGGGYRRLETLCDAGHLASLRVLEKAGFTRGHIRASTLHLPAFGPSPRDAYEFWRC